MPALTRSKAARPNAPTMYAKLADRKRAYPHHVRRPLYKKHARWGPMPAELVEKTLLKAMEVDDFCLFEYFCHRWGICAPGEINQGPFPGDELQIQVNAAGVLVRDPLRLDCYQSGVGPMAGAPGTHQVEVAPHGMNLPHLYLPIYRWLAQVVLHTTRDAYTWYTAINVLARKAMQVLEKETFIVGAAPAPGAPDTRYLGFRGFMISPIIEKYFGPGPANPVPGQPFPDRGHNSNQRDMAEIFLNRPGVHHTYVSVCGFSEGGQTIQNEAAQALKSKYDEMGGPRALFLGPEVMDGMKMGTTAQWQARISAQDVRSPVTTIDWSRMTRLKTLVLDFHDFRVMQVNAGNFNAYADTDTWIVNTVNHIVNEWTNPDGTRRNPGLKTLVVGGLRTDIERGIPTAAGPPFFTYQPLYEDPGVLPTIAQMEAPGAVPGAAAATPNWYFHFRKLLRPGGELYLLDMDQVNAALMSFNNPGGEIVGPYREN